MLASLVISTKNQILKLFSSEHLAQFLAECKLVELKLGEILTKPNDEIEYIYFPIESIIAWIQPVDKEVGMVVALIGNEGMLSISPLLGVNTTSCRAIVQKEGSAIRIGAPNLLILLEKFPEMDSILRRYIHIVFSQVMQMAACTRFHIIEQRLAKILLMLKDRGDSTEFQITQKSLASMLGVRRVGISEAAGVLQRKNLISYKRGSVSIHDIQELEDLACNCYSKDKELYKHFIDFAT